MKDDPIDFDAYQVSRAVLDRLKKIFRWDDETSPDHPESQNRREVFEALCLVDKGALEPNIFCTSEWIKEIKERLLNPHETSTVIHAMSRVHDTSNVPMPKELHPHWMPSRPGCYQLQSMNLHWELAGYDNLKRDLINDIPSTWATNPVETYTECVLDGVNPTPEIQLSIAKAFKLYLMAEGRLTLEEVLFGRPKKKSGNFAKRSRRNRLYQSFHVEYRVEARRARLVGRSILTAESYAVKYLAELRARKMIGPHDSIDESSFVRGYHRWKEQNPDITD